MSIESIKQRLDAPIVVPTFSDEHLSWALSALVAEAIEPYRADIRLLLDVAEAANLFFAAIGPYGDRDKYPKQADALRKAWRALEAAE